MSHFLLMKYHPEEMASGNRVSEILEESSKAFDAYDMQTQTMQTNTFVTDFQRFIAYRIAIMALKEANTTEELNDQHASGKCIFQAIILLSDDSYKGFEERTIDELITIYKSEDNQGYIGIVMRKAVDEAASILIQKSTNENTLND